MVFDLGTNDYRVDTLTTNLRGARREAAGRVMVVFTLNKPGAGPFNRATEPSRTRADNVVVVDWQSAAVKERLLGGDGIHASATGYKRRAALVEARLRALRPPLRPAPQVAGAWTSPLW